jgi:hypothetical protein
VFLLIIAGAHAYEGRWKVALYWLLAAGLTWMAASIANDAR